MIGYVIDFTSQLQVWYAENEFTISSEQLSWDNERKKVLLTHDLAAQVDDVKLRPLTKIYKVIIQAYKLYSFARKFIQPHNRNTGKQNTVVNEIIASKLSCSVSHEQVNTSCNLQHGAGGLGGSCSRRSCSQNSLCRVAQYRLAASYDADLWPDGEYVLFSDNSG